MTENKATVFVVDDDSALRDALSGLLETVGFAVRAYGSAEEFLAAYRPGLPGCLLLDVRMRGMSGLELQAALAKQEPTLPVIMVTGHGDIPMAVQAMNAGALDFLEKPVHDEVLVERVRQALQLDERRRAEWQQRGELAARLASLTAREREVLRLVVAGMPSKQIAVQLAITQKTVEVHRKHLLDKMQARNTVALVRTVTAAGLSV